MENKDLIREIQELFIGKILQKNSWGKNEIISIWKDCLAEMLMKRIDK